MSVIAASPRPLESMSRHAGWAMVLRGILAVAFGIIALRSPNVAAAALVIVFAVYAFADGIVDFVLAGRLGRAGQSWGWYVFQGIITVALGVIALAVPGITFVALVFYVALRAILLGIVELVGAFSWHEHDHRWLLGLAGVLSIMLGVVLLASPVVGGLALVWTIGVYALVIGVALFASGLHLIGRAWHEKHERESGPPPAQRPAATAG